MTVAELIRLLEGFPPELRVVVRGYEEGVDDVALADVQRLKLNAFDEWWNGDHALITGNAGVDELAVYIRGRDKHADL